MWGKVSFHRTRKPSGGTPSPTDSQAYQPSSRSVSHNRDLSTKALPTLPTGPPNSRITAHQPEHPRVASSVYSRDTVVLDHSRQRSISDNYRSSPQMNAPNSGYGYAQGTRSVDISPPDSPITRTRSRGSSRVSPIEDESGRHTPTGSNFSSHIPVLRKRVDSLPDQRPPKPASRAHATRWDDFSGEPTSSRQGRIGQANSSNVSFETHVSAAPLPSHSSKILGWGKDQLTSRKKTTSEARDRFYETNPVAPFAHREPWKGQSGRAPMVAPIEEKPSNRSSSRLRLSRSFDRLKDMNTPSPAPETVRPSTTTTTIAGKENFKQEPRRNTPYDAREAEGNASAISNAPPRVDLIPGPRLSDSLTDLRLADDDVHEPVSRFSVTTYNPTEFGSPTPSLRGSITPSPPASIIDTASQFSDTARTIMSRARPVPSSIAPGKRPVRKPTPSEIPSNKELPQNPAEATAQGRIEMLEAKKSDLLRRRTNINTIIHELTQVIQPSSIAYDMAAREEVKKTVVSLNNELAEIKREEHEVGLKLLRAWKKRENDDAYGHTSIWVKRVTS
ncbi:hypothetical protein BJX99DRAFT_264810 [Aspergillus californicus]